jgi:hypothetical protein
LVSFITSAHRYDDDGYFPATPCCKRAVHEAADLLKSLGHEVIKFEIPNIREIIFVYFNHMLGDAGITSLEIWEGENLDQVPIFQSYFTNGKKQCKTFYNDTASFLKCKQLFEYQHLLLLRGIWWSKFQSIFKCC